MREPVDITITSCDACPSALENLPASFTVAMVKELDNDQYHRVIEGLCGDCVLCQ